MENEGGKNSKCEYTFVLSWDWQLRRKKKTIFRLDLPHQHYVEEDQVSVRGANFLFLFFLGGGFGGGGSGSREEQSWAG